MADQRTPHGDEAELFRTHNATLMRDVARSVTLADPGVVEDACSFAWMQFMHHQPDRDRNWHGWMFRAAQHEAWRLESQAREDRPLRTSEDERKPTSARRSTRATTRRSAWTSTRRCRSSTSS